MRMSSCFVSDELGTLTGVSVCNVHVCRAWHSLWLSGDYDMSETPASGSQANGLQDGNVPGGGSTVVGAGSAVAVLPAGHSPLSCLRPFIESDFSPKASPSVADLETLVKSGYATVESVLATEKNLTPLLSLPGFNALKCRALFVLANMQQIKLHSFKTALDFSLSSARLIKFIQTGSKKLNAVLGGYGVSTGSLTLIFADGCQYARVSLGHTLAVICQFGGVDGQNADRLGNAGATPRPTATATAAPTNSEVSLH